MPLLTCPECGAEWAHTGGNTAVSCPTPTCGGHVQVGGPGEPRKDGGLSIREVRDRLAERKQRTTPPS
jgi:hypothetical protein